MVTRGALASSCVRPLTAYGRASRRKAWSATRAHRNTLALFPKGPLTTASSERSDLAFCVPHALASLQSEAFVPPAL